MEWKKATKQDTHLVQIPERWLHLYYYEALNVLFRFENALRVFVYVILKKEFNEKWSETAISSGGSIKSETKSRIAKAKEHAYLGYELSSPMLYLNSGELIDIIISDAYWKYFSPFFKASRSIVSTKLQEIGMVRNSLAHFRPIKEDDIDLIKQNTKHVLLEIEKCLIQLTAITTIVPSNSNDDWYKEIKPIGSESLKISIFHSEDEEWVRVSIIHTIPTLEKKKFGENYYSYKAGNFRTDQLFSEFPILKDKCIYLSEGHLWGGQHPNFDLNSVKEISLVFAKNCLSDNLQNIVKALKEIVQIVDEETDLLKQDNLARGKLIETKSANASIRTRDDGSSYWSVSLNSMTTPLVNTSEVEYWGTRAHYETDFISGSNQYPWMPDSISDYEIPF
ncbi:Swt1 family HEPN domain-containing protein [Methylophaga thalassica]|uniref:Swt1 family HEPN domain-containing protein n=1 Tax=Methylophaga aminisulfidivorans TaxID=230105 RepID=UPI0024E2098E|nr:Swt1 family HEPN domain-containing protein [Methylophaga aminisulfidivorans]